MNNEKQDYNQQDSMYSNQQYNYQYQQQGDVYPYYVQGQSERVPNDLGITSLILGIVCFIVPIVGIIAAPLGIILGMKQLGIFKQHPSKSQEGKVLAVIGIVLSAIWLGLVLITVVIIIFILLLPAIIFGTIN